MSDNHFQFETHWRVPGSPEQVTEILTDVTSLPRWWPQVYLKAQETAPGVFSFHTRGFLPYTLCWNSRLIESHAPYGFSISAWGDLEGTGRWTFAPDGAFTNVQYLWIVRAKKPLLNWLSPLLKPVFKANHRWAMARGEQALICELSRRYAEAPLAGEKGAQMID